MILSKRFDKFSQIAPFTNYLLYTKIVFLQPRRKRLPQGRGLFAHCQRWENWNFFKKNFLPKLFAWTRSNQFWQPCQKKFQEIAEIFTQCPRRMIKKIVISTKKYLAPKSSIDHVHSSFDNTADNLFPQGRSFFTLCPKLMETKILSKRFEKIFQNVPFIFCTGRLHIYSLVKNFLPEGRKLIVQYPKVTK